MELLIKNDQILTQVNVQQIVSVIEIGGVLTSFIDKDVIISIKSVKKDDPEIIVNKNKVNRYSTPFEQINEGDFFVVFENGYEAILEKDLFLALFPAWPRNYS